MKSSSREQVRALYEESADGYAGMMDAEIKLPIYADTLGRLAQRIAHLPGVLIDTSCGSGHMLSLYHHGFDAQRPLVGIDISPRMVAIAAAKLGASAQILNGDMCQLETMEDGSGAAVLSFFAIHHLDPGELLLALQEWRRALQSGGQLVLAAWEGTGQIDYADDSDIVALRYKKDELDMWVQSNGFTINRIVVEPVEGMPMQAIYLEATAEGQS